MVNDERLKQLRALGIKSAAFLSTGEITMVEFFPTISPLDLDTLIPPPPGLPTEVDAAEPVKVPPAMARILKRGSVS